MTDLLTKLCPEISFKIWLLTKDFVISKHICDANRPFLKSIPDDTWKADFELGISPIESVMAYFEDAEGTEQPDQAD